MKIEQIYTGCLAQGAYYIESDGNVAIIDPLRETEPYLELTSKNNSKIVYIFETHFHADFVSGHVTLAKQTNAEIVYGPNAETSFKSTIATDGQLFKLGKVTIEVIHTPGHTMESSCYLLRDENGKQTALFTGDTLFLGDVGRPDLAQKTGVLTEKDLAGILFDSLRNKIMVLPDDLVIYPGHGAGSACGKNLSSETTGNLGKQKKTNYALRANMTKNEFIEEVTDGLQAPPKYFPLNVQMNKEGYEDIGDLIKKGTHALNPDEFLELAEQTKALVLDVRTEQEFVAGHIPQSVFIGINGSFAPWVGSLIGDTKTPILLVTPIGKEEETIIRLARVGFDNTLGYLKGSFDSWKTSKEYDTIKSISATEFEGSYNSSDTKVFDVRKENEYVAAHLKEVKHTPLTNLNEFLKDFPKQESFYIYCGGGYRSVITGSILKKRGIHNFIDIAGGFAAIKKTSLEITDFICPSKLKNK
jgi:glyoxylase-like metal-dependent hydrolase (beta-lactamase superfamily II)/rhodanese-related sulfurtransferase